MAEERHGIEVGIDSRDAKRGENEVVRSLDNIKKKTEEVGKAGEAGGKRAGDGLGKAAGGADKAGRSIDAIKAKARGAGDAAGSAGDRASAAFTKATGNIDRATAAAARMHPPLKQIETTMTRVSQTRVFDMPNKSATGFLATLGSVRSLLAATAGIAIGQNIASTAVQFKGFDQALKIVTGSTQAANAELAWAEQTANKLGFRIADVTKTYVGFSAAAKGTALEGEEQRHVFESITRAAAAYGLTNDQLKGSLLAVQQMIGKGTVSAEELRGQLGERLPGAVQIAARAMGVTTQVLFKMMEQGQLTSDTFLAKFANQLDKEIPKSARSANAAFNEFLSQLDKAKLAIANGGFFEGLASGAASLAKAMQDLADSGTLASIGSAIGGVLKFLGENIELLKTAAIAWGVYFAAIKVQALVAFVSQLVALEIALGATTTGTALLGVTMKGLQAIFMRVLGPIGLIVGAITGLIALYQHLTGVSDDLDIRTKKINDTFRDAASVLSDAKHWGDEAAGAIKGTGTDSSSAEPKIKSFAGEVGNAADQLYRLAQARQADYIASLQQKRQKASLEFSEAWKNTDAGRQARVGAAHGQMRNAGSLSEFFGGMGDAIKGNSEALWFGNTQEGQNQEQMTRARRSMEMLDEAIQIAAKDLEHFVPKKTPGSEVVGKPKPVKRDPNAEVGRNWTANEVAALARKAGLQVNGTDRTAQQQQAQIDKWMAQERVRKGSGGIRPAAVGTSAHERGKGVDFGANVSISQIRDFAKKNAIPIKQLLNEGDHKHMTIGGARSAQEKSEEKLLDLAERRKENEAEFWAQMQGSVEEAGKLPGEAEAYNKELELRKILNDGELANAKELDPLVKQRIQDAIKEKAQKQLIADITQQSISADVASVRLADQEKAMRADSIEQQEDQMALEERMWGIKEQALINGVNLQDEAVKKAYEELEARERTNIAMERKNRLIAEGNAAVDDLVRDSQSPQQQLQTDFEKQMQRIKLSSRSEALKNVAIKEAQEQYADAMNKINDEFAEDMLDSVHRIADAFGGAFGEIVDGIGTLAVMVNQMLQAGYKAGTVGAKANNPVSQLFSGMQDISKNLSTALGPSSKFGQMLGKAGGIFGQASDGAAMGQQTAQIMKALGVKKFSTMGAEIGGAAGNVIGTAIAGPIGGMIGSILGSLAGGFIGGALKKPKFASATITDVYSDVKAKGDGADQKGQANQMARGVQDGILQVATALGAQIGAFAVSIGVDKNGDYVVDTLGRGRLKSGDNNTPEFKTAEEAMAFAIVDAIRDGALKGLSAATDRVMKTVTTSNLNKLIQAAQTYEGLMQSVAMLADPAKATFAQFLKGWELTMSNLKGAGYTYDELIALTVVFADQQKKILEELTAGYRAFLEELTMGPNSGKTVFQQFQDAMAAFTTLQASGTYTQDQFTQAGQRVFDLARQVYGTATPEFEAIKAQLVAATQAAIDGVSAGQQAAIDSAGIITAIGAGTTQAEISNALLRAILDRLYGPQTVVVVPPPTTGTGTYVPPPVTVPVGSTTGTTTTPIPDVANDALWGMDPPDLYSRTTRLEY